MRRRFILFTALFAFLLAFLGTAHPATPSQTKHAIGKLASYLSPAGLSQTDEHLLKQGFPKQWIDSQPGWAQFSDTRKLDYATRAAEQGQAGGGQQFLARLSRALAQTYQTVSADVDIMTIVNEAPIAAEPLKFARPVSSDTSSSPLRRQEKLAIATLARYMTRGSQNVDWAIHVMLKDPEAAHEILVHSDTIEVALSNAYKSLDAKQRDLRFAEVLRQVAKSSVSARGESAFQPYLTEASADSTSRTHVVKKGETLSKIASKYRLTYTQLGHFNSIPDVDLIEIGQVLQIPGTPPVVPSDLLSNYTSRWSPSYRRHDDTFHSARDVYGSLARGDASLGFDKNSYNIHIGRNVARIMFEGSYIRLHQSLRNTHDILMHPMPQLKVMTRLPRLFIR